MRAEPQPAPYRPDMPILALAPWLADPVAPAEFPQTTLRFRNSRWDSAVGLDKLSEAQWIAHFARFEPLPDNLTQPLALRYHGHQFGVYNPELGDGRGTCSRNCAMAWVAWSILAPRVRGKPRGAAPPTGG